jgi:PAS domain S-box-containing protein
MMTSIRQWFNPPIFEDDEEQTRRASFVNASIHSIFILLSLALLSLFSGGSMPANVIVSDMLALGILLFLRYWLHRGKITLVGSAVLIMGFSFATFTAANLGTVRTPTTTMYLFLIVLAGVLFEVRGIVSSTIFSSLLVGALIIAENAGILPQPDYSVTATQWITYTVLFATIGWIAFFARQSAQASLERAEQEIKARKQAEIELRKLTRAVEQSPASIVITDLDGNIEYVNPRFTQVTGYTFNEALGHNPRILRTDQTRPETHVALWQTLQAGQEWRGEFVNRKKNGELYYESAVISSITDQQGIPTHYLAVKEDVTKMRENEMKLRASEARFRSLFAQHRDAVFMSNLDGQIIEMNQAGLDMLGYTREEIDGMNYKALLPQDHQSTNTYAKLMDGKTVPLLERRFIRKNGQVFPVETSIDLIRDKDGTPLHSQIVVRDITERKQAEEKLRQQNEHLFLLHQTTLDLLNRRDLDELLQLIVDRVVILLDAPFAELMLEENGELVVQTFTKNQDFTKGERVGREQARLTWKAFDTKLPVVLDDYATYPLRREIYEDTPIHAVADFPIMVRDQCIGVLALGRSQPDYPFTEAQVKNGVLFAQLAALVLDSARLFVNAQREIAARTRMEDMLFNQNQRLSVLHQLTIELLKNRDVDTLLSTIVTHAAELVGASYGSIFLSEGDELVLRAAMSDFEMKIGTKESKPGLGVLGEVWRHMKPLVIENYSQWAERDPTYANQNLRAFAGIPIIGHDGPLGVLQVARTAENIEKFIPQEIEVFFQFASLASLVLDNAQLSGQAQLEREKADDLLLNILPYEIAARLKEDSSQLVAERFEQASILFADVVNFTELSATLAPEELVELLNDVFSNFDDLVEKHGLEKIKTIGDCYMAVAGVPRPILDHAHALTSLALDIQSCVATREFKGRRLSLRIGINSGPVVAGVIGNKKFAYDMWGDAVNVASRMESQGIGGVIQITQATYDIIHSDFICQPQGTINVKGKGEMNIWHVLGIV